MLGFTFHYVSIKSAIAFDDGDGNIDLHSTMYLLNLKIAKKLKLFPEFTFHYVSIKSDNISCSMSVARLFTFHYVSIKSVTAEMEALEVLDLHSTMYLLNQRIYYLLER